MLSYIYVVLCVILSSIYDIILCYIKLHLRYITLHLCYMFCHVKLHLRYVVFIYDSFNNAVITSRLHNDES